jgi:hypothetical protein
MRVLELYFAISRRAHSHAHEPGASQLVDAEWMADDTISDPTLLHATGLCFYPLATLISLPVFSLFSSSTNSTSQPLPPTSFTTSLVPNLSALTLLTPARAARHHLRSCSTSIVAQSSSLARASIAPTPSPKRYISVSHKCLNKVCS